MKRLNDLVAVIGFSIAALLFFEIPQIIPNNDLNSSLAYLLLGATFFYITWSYKLPTLAYFRLPELSVPSLAGMLVVIFYSWSSISSDTTITLPLWPTVTGIIYLFTIGAGEEFLSRGFAFGVLKKYGTVYAVVVSSILFGLMHLNLYLGDEWDPAHAYWHCLSAAGFGAVCAVVMIVCRSIVAPIVMHSLYDWTVVFVKPEDPSGPVKPWEFDPLWQTIKDSFATIGIELFFIFFLLSVLGLSRIRRFPRFLSPLLLKFGLIEDDRSSSSSDSGEHLNPIGS